MRLTGATRVAAVIGSPVHHSLSPAIHNAAFEACGLDWAFVAFDVDETIAYTAIDAMRALNLGGLSVTMPCKTAIARLVDDCSPAATALDAVNCVRWDGDRLVGESTDGGGFLRALKAELEYSVSGRRCCVVGAGGAGRAVVHALALDGAAEVCVVNRSADRAAEAVRLGGVVGDEASLSAAELVVNATPVGMTDDAFPFDVDLLTPNQVVVDLIYHPAETPLLRAASEIGATTMNGVGMLVHQAAMAFELWTGRDAPLDAMKAAVS